MEGRNFCCYKFDEFRLDARRRALSKNGEEIPLTSRNFELLLFMVKNGGRVLEHNELLDQVWAGTFVEQATLIKGVSVLRRILEARSETEFIKTIPRCGYSFVSPVSLVPEDREILFVRETEREIIVEEFEEIDDLYAPYKIIDAARVKAFPSAKTKINNLTRPAILGAAAIALQVAKRNLDFSERFGQSSKYLIFVRADKNQTKMTEFQHGINPKDASGVERILVGVLFDRTGRKTVISGKPKN